MAQGSPQILFEDDDWCVVDKPAGWVVIPGRNQEPVLQKWATESMVRKTPKSQAWVVHRIDRDTSGLVLFAKGRESHRTANGWFEKGEIEKTYRFVAHGKPDSPIFKVTLPIETKKSITQFQVIEQRRDFFLGEARLVTGRRHQIRIHLKSLEMPIAGDPKYGAPASPFRRQALHAFRLKLPTGRVIESAWPADLVEAWRGIL